MTEKQDKMDLFVENFHIASRFKLKIVPQYHQRENCGKETYPKIVRFEKKETSEDTMYVQKENN